jgi:hypothetical protein
MGHTKQTIGVVLATGTLALAGLIWGGAGAGVQGGGGSTRTVSVQEAQRANGVDGGVELAANGVDGGIDLDEI